jgi:hemerythrin-like domain-containing protein
MQPSFVTRADAGPRSIAPALLMPSQLNALLEEHRSIAAVLQGMRHLLHEKQRPGAKIDPSMFSAMLYYLDVFSERVHHPKEEAVLFEVLRHRTRAVDGVLDELEREHETGEAAIRDLERLLLRYMEGGEAEFPAFAAKVNLYVETYFEHMRKEEELLMPYAREALTARDWSEVEKAFADNKDPLRGVDATDYRQLFARILRFATLPASSEREGNDPC